MKITDISQAVRNPDRVNVSVDGKYRFSLDIFQVGELGIRIGKEYSEKELIELETESQFGKLYARALEYCMMRPHSKKEVKDYLWRKTRPTKKYIKPQNSQFKEPFSKDSKDSRLRGDAPVKEDCVSGESSTSAKGSHPLAEKVVREVAGVSQEVADRVFARLVEKKYLDDERFAAWWVENRNQAKGTSKRKLQAELRAKGVEAGIIEQALADTQRSDEDELAKIVAKKRRRYDDEQKFMAYLARQGFSYDDIKSALQASDDRD